MKGGTFLLPALLKTLVLPPTLLYFLLQISPSLPTLLIPFLYLFSFPISYILRSRLSVYQTQRQASSHGAREIPRVRGTYPLNLDVMLDWMKSGSEEEVGRMMVLLGRKYGRTHNTRVFGEDQVCILLFS
jgi:hypothetical protein